MSGLEHTLTAIPGAWTFPSVADSVGSKNGLEFTFPAIPGAWAFISSIEFDWISMASKDAPEVEERGDDHGSARSQRFRFKQKRPRETSHTDDLDPDERRKRHRSSRPHTSSGGSADHDHRRNRHRRDKKSEQPPRNPVDDPTLYDDAYLPSSRSSVYMDPETAFRESLFDALADDEGAAFWEGVYGQPVHTYSSMKTGPDGELERMTDEEYAAHVRARMYEKTHEHLIEERERREEERRRKERVRRETEELGKARRDFERLIDSSLRRGEERKFKARWKARWETYLASWDRLQDGGIRSQDGHVGRDRLEPEASTARKEKNRKYSDMIPWPVESGRIRDIGKDAIESFFHQCSGSSSSATEAHTRQAHLLGILKLERVRWHPDKMQQRLGLGGLASTARAGPSDDEDDRERTMKAVTAVFQVVDRMWSEQRAKQ